MRNQVETPATSTFVVAEQSRSSSNETTRAQESTSFSKKHGDIVLRRLPKRDVAKRLVGVIRVTDRKKGIGRSEGLCASGAKGGRRLGRTGGGSRHLGDHWVTESGGGGVGWTFRGAV